VVLPFPFKKLLNNTETGAILELSLPYSSSYYFRDVIILFVDVVVFRFFY
jgi:hypothetical protein